LPESAEDRAQSRGARMDVPLDKDIERLVRSRAAQGLPLHVEDQSVLAQVATLLQAALSKSAARRAT